MSQDIIMEVNFFINSLLIGVVITFAYDWLLILRKCIRHHIAFISIEDIIFWIACALFVFYMLYRENNGILRWFAVLGATLGMLLYKKLISPIFVQVTSDIIIKTFQLLVRPVLYICRKIYALLRKIYMFLRRKSIIYAKKGRKVTKIAKKKLTIQARLIRIYLCKQEHLIQRKFKERYGQTQKKNRIP